MTLVDALAKSPVGMAYRHYSDLVRQVATRDRAAYFVSPVAVAPTSWPGGGEDWEILLAGPTQKRIQDAVPCGPRA